MSVRGQAERAAKRAAKSAKQLGRIGPLIAEIKRDQSRTERKRAQQAEWEAGKHKRLGKLRCSRDI